MAAVSLAFASGTASASEAGPRLAFLRWVEGAADSRPSSRSRRLKQAVDWCAGWPAAKRADLDRFQIPFPLSPGPLTARCSPSLERRQSDPQGWQNPRCSLLRPTLGGLRALRGRLAGILRCLSRMAAAWPSSECAAETQAGQRRVESMAETFARTSIWLTQVDGGAKQMLTLWREAVITTRLVVLSGRGGPWRSRRVTGPDRFRAGGRAASSGADPSLNAKPAASGRLLSGRTEGRDGPDRSSHLPPSLAGWASNCRH